MTAYMLDTNVASHVIRGDRPEIGRRLVALPLSDMVISAVTEGALFYGLAKRQWPPALTERVRQFLLRVDVLAWDHDVTRCYGELRASCEAKGIVLAPLDLMIAAHAVAVDAVLVTQDKAFARVPPPLKREDWTDPGP